MSDAIEFLVDVLFDFRQFAAEVAAAPTEADWERLELAAQRFAERNGLSEQAGRELYERTRAEIEQRLAEKHGGAIHNA